MSPNQLTPGTIRPGGRSTRVRNAVVEAVLAELSSTGYDGVTVETIAARSGVHKATIYRRWGGVDGLIAETLDHSAEISWPIPDTGTLASDLQEITRTILASFTDPRLGPIASALINAGLRSTAGARALAAFFATRLTQAAQIVTRAIERGELPPSTDALEVIRATTAPLYYRLFITNEPLNEEIAHRAAAAAVAAAYAGVFDTTG